jgi:hypothetical protein
MKVNTHVKAGGGGPIRCYWINWGEGVDPVQECYRLQGP